MPKYFPIKTETACALKWSWNTVKLYNGETSSCHRVQPDSITEFDLFHNTDKKIADRQLMLAGKWPQGGCEYCSDVEAVGGYSDRQLHLNIPDTYPQELDGNPTLTHVNPTILEVYLDNVCNMSCLYCYDGFSSQIQQENNQYGVFDSNGVVIQNRTQRHANYEQLKDNFWTWMKANSTSLKRLHILGGEPFYQKDFATCLDYLEDSQHSELEFNVVSNLNIKHDVFVKQIARIKQLVHSRRIKRFDLTASIDCWGPEQEYVRQGLDLALWRSNFEFLVEQTWIELNINQTLSVLTIKTIPEMLDYVNSLSRPIGHYMGGVTLTYDFLHPKIFGKGFYSQDFSRIIKSIRYMGALKYMQGFVLQLESCERDQVQINQLATYLSELDRRRNTNWQQTFPWLKSEITNVV